MRTWRYIRLKAQRRLKPILAHILSGFVSPLLNIALSWWVVESAGEDVWGGFVDYRLVAVLAVGIIAWGNNDWLLRAFARTPSQVGYLWRRIFVSRAILLFIALPLVLIAPLKMDEASLLFLWIVAGFVAQSFQVAVLYTRRFSVSIIADLVSYVAVFGGLIFFGETWTPDLILRYFVIGQVARAIVLAIGFRKPYLVGEFGNISFRYFYLALPFFIHYIAGMLISRVDLYCVSWMLKEDALTGRYQIFIAFLIHLQSLAGFILLPFVKNIYRLSNKSIGKVALRLFAAGVVITLLGVPAVWAVVTYGFGIVLSWKMYLWGGLMVLPIWYYSPFIYLLYKSEEQQKVVLANVGGVLVNVALNLVLIRVMELEGAILASFVGQVFMLVVVMIYARGVKE